MIRLKIKIDEQLAARILGAQKKAAFRNLSHAAASIRKTAQQSIKPAPKEQRRRARKRGGRIVRRASHGASRPGEPIRTQRGQARRAITYHATATSAVIGPRGSVMDDAMVAHEFGGHFRGQEYPARPVMGPALEQNVARFGRSFRGSIGPTTS